MAACGGAVVKPDQAQTATAPPSGASSSAVERLLGIDVVEEPVQAIH